MLQYVPSTCRKVLDVGCGAGHFGELLKSGMNVEVWGVEIAEDAAKEAVVRLDKVVVDDIEKDKVELPAAYFDCIVFNDVLEHLRDPWNVLARCAAYLGDQGYVVASIPNVRYYLNIHKLLVSRTWEYEDDGILDRTHLRFFTEMSIHDMFIKSGYHVLNVEGIRERKFSRKMKVLNFLLRNSFGDMKYPQFAVLAQKAGKR